MTTTSGSTLAPQNIEIRTNSDLTFSDRWLDDAGAPYILSDARFQVRKRDGELLLEASVDNGWITLDATDGWWTVYITAAELTEELEWFGVGVWDSVVVREDDGQTALTGGYVRIRQGVTRDEGS